MTGGYLVGSLDIIDPNAPDEPAVRYRFVHQYSYTQSPEFHLFTLEGREGTIATNLRFGHSYGYPTPEELWEFEDWMTEISEGFRLGQEPVRIEINWEGRPPYPEGEDITGRISDPKQGLDQTQR